MSVPYGVRFSVIEDCEDVWNEYVDANVTATADTASGNRKMGTAGAKFVIAAGAAAGTIMASEVVSTTIIGTGVWMWIKTSVTLAAGDFQILLDDTALSASPHETLDIPAISSTGTWERVYIAFANPASGTAVISISLKMVVDKTMDFYLDDIRQGTALSVYTLQTTISPEIYGVITYLYSEFSGLTVPSYVSLDVSGEVVEMVDMIPGTTRVGEVTMTFAEDRTNYQEGFWFKVLSGYAEIKISVYEDEDDPSTVTTYFWGIISSTQSPFEEISLIPGYIVRNGEISCVDLMTKLKETPAEDVIQMIKGNSTTFSSTITGSDLPIDCYFIRLSSVVSYCFEAATGLVGGVVTTGTDIQFDPTGAPSWIDWTDAWVCLGDFDSGFFGYFNSTSSQYWGSKFGSAWELLVALSKQLGFVPRRTVSDGFELNSRGKDFATDTYSAPEESQFLAQSFPPISVVSVDHISSDYSNTWAQEGRAWCLSGLVVTPSATTDVIPAGQNPDIDVSIMFFGSTTASYTDSPDQWLFADDGAGGVTTIAATRHWDYNAAAYNTDETTLAANLALYYFNRFGYSIRGYARTYAQLRQGSTSSPVNSYRVPQLFRVTTINDDVSNRDFYLVETRKSLNSSKMFCMWREV